jgi:ribosomal protein L36
MNHLTRLLKTFQVLPSKIIVTVPCYNVLSRGFTSLLSSSKAAVPVSSLLDIKPLEVQQHRNYKMRHILKKRCRGCYFERREGRLFVECTLRRRHKQMQFVKGYGIPKDDYCKGNWRKAVHWAYRTDGKLYKWGDNSQFSKYPWLKDRLGHEI